MNQQLKRIKQKDFTKIDQKLFDNVSRTDNLNFTLTHLSQFQKFLMEQIASLNNSSASNTKDNKIADSLVKTFDHLKQSIMKCSNMRQRQSHNKYMKLMKQINELKKTQSKTIKQIVSQKDLLFYKTKQDYQKVVNMVVHRYQTQKSKNKQLQLKISKMESQLRSHKEEKSLNIQIIQKQKIIDVQNKNRVLRQIEIIKKSDILKQVNLNRSNCKEKHSQKINDKVNQINDKNNYVNNYVSCYNSNNTIQSSILQNYLNLSINNTPLKRSHSNQRAYCKSQLSDLKDKQNSSKMITKCDVIQSSMKRGKSKQKIKLCSMF